LRDAVLLLPHITQGKKYQREDNNTTVCVHVCARTRAHVPAWG